MSEHSTPQPARPGIADPSAVAGVSRQVARNYAAHFALIGVATLVVGALLALLRPAVAIPAGLVILALCIVALGRFVGSRSAMVTRFARFAQTFWIVQAVVLLATIAAVLWWAGHQWTGWLGGALGLVNGLGTAFAIDRAAQTPAADASSALH